MVDGVVSEENARVEFVDITNVDGAKDVEHGKEHDELSFKLSELMMKVSTLEKSLQIKDDELKNANQKVNSLSVDLEAVRQELRSIDNLNKTDDSQRPQTPADARFGLEYQSRIKDVVEAKESQALTEKELHNANFEIEKLRADLDSLQAKNKFLTKSSHEVMKYIIM